MGLPKATSTALRSHRVTDDPSDHFHDECGVFGVHGTPEAARLTCIGLHGLQHRGQEGAGIVSSDRKILRGHRGLGLVGDVFSGSEVESLTGDLALGHVRYSTAGDTSIRNVQPLVVRYQQGQLAVAHNGNLCNAGNLREDIESMQNIQTWRRCKKAEGCVVRTSCTPKYATNIALSLLKSSSIVYGKQRCEQKEILRTDGQILNT